MPKISVVTIARSEEECRHLGNRLREGQTFTDFEFVYSTKGTIPEAWNDAVARATGDYVVFTETDAVPLGPDWLARLNHHLRPGIIAKGIEVRPTNLNMCNLIVDRSILGKAPFDESFPVAEDDEFFARMRSEGHRIEHIPDFPVVHSPQVSWKKTIGRAFAYGVQDAKIYYRYGSASMESVRTQLQGRNSMNPIANRIRILVENSLFILGLTIGALTGWKESRGR